jgi:translocation and assembly module TamB
VGGTLDVDATVANVSKGITPDSVQGRANINLQPSSVAGLEISHAVIDGDYRDSTADIRTLDIVGRDINVKANGTLALNETGQSNLKLHADSPSLDQIGKLVNRPLAGIGKLDATVTGNKRELQATGNVTGDSFKYGDNGALTASSDYTVKIPELRMVDASVDATTHATFVTLSGQNINDLTAKTAYHQKQLDFDANAKQPARSLGVAGSVLMHPEHQEIHLQRLALQTAGMTWSLAPQSKPAIQYGNNAVKVEDLMLVNGDQQISADGSFGHAGDALKLTLNNVDLASVDAILLRPPQFSGRAKASATITSTASSPATSSSVVSGFSRTPQIKADFQISQGGFRQFHYDRFSGTVDYGGKGIMLDTKLQQNPSQWMTAKGYIPATAFKTPANGAPRAHHEALAAEDRIDLHVESTPIDLGLVQGFTTALINVTGTVQAKVDVTGAADDPHPTGAITVQNAAFTVAPTGVVYAGLDGKIDLQGDRIHVDQIRVLDNQRKPLTIAGDLGVHELQVGQFNVAVKASDFKIIDNEMGNVRVNSDLRIAGELRAPRVEGDLGVTTGVVNLDPIIASTSESAYATEQTEYLGTAKNNNGQTAPPSAFDALKMDVHVTVPNDLVVRGNDLRTPGSPIGMGAMSVTLGGDIRATKNPGGQITLVGVVNTVRGTYDFQGRRFDVQRDGSVRFQGDTVADMNPALDIRTRRIIQAVEARVNIRGTLKQPEIELNSTPPLEQADILSLIVFNQPINQLGEAQQMSLVQRAQALATGAVASQLAQSIGNALNLDTFEINIAPDSGATAQLTVGQQVGQNLYVKVQQGIGDQAQTNFVLEYELAKWLRLQTNVLQGSTTQQQLFQRMQGTGVDLLFFFSY